MKLVAIYNVWDDWDLLDHSVKNMESLVDGFIVVGSTKSNYGEVSGIPDRWKDKVMIAEPQPNVPASMNETFKRNYGLSMARRAGYTHFIMMDADEFYEPAPFLKEKERFLNPNLNGLVCSCQTYFKSPSLTIGLDTTLITFIHKITPTLKFDFNKSFPFAWEGRNIRIDPTRQLNINSGVEWSDVIMHHYSWVRKDVEKKIRNSTARANLQRSSIREDFLSAKEGGYCKFYGKKLIRASVDFNLPEFDVHESIQPLAASHIKEQRNP